MKRRGLMLALLFASLFGGWAASAGANLPQLPHVPAPPKIPTLPLLPSPPRVPQVPPVPRVPDAPPVSHPSVPVHVGAPAGPSLSGSTGAQSSSAQSRPSRTGPTKVYRLHFSRDWIARTEPKQGRQTVLTFVLRRPALVEFVVFQISPDCRRLGRFRVQGRRGLNRVRFRGLIGRRVLGPGTYRIKARAVSSRRTLAVKRLIVVSRANKTEIAAARSVDTCAAGHGTNGRSNGSATGAGSGVTTGTGSSSQATGAPAVNKATTKPKPSRSHGVLGARFTRNAVNAIESIPTWLFVLLGLAIALLAVAALPLWVAPNGRTAAVLAHRRGLIALAGAAALVAVTVSFALH